jgi:hypothetical protein
MTNNKEAVRWYDMQVCLDLRSSAMLYLRTMEKRVGLHGQSLMELKKMKCRRVAYMNERGHNEQAHISKPAVVDRLASGVSDGGRGGHTVSGRL